MKMEQQIINDIITSVSPELWYLFLQMIGTLIVCFALYQGLRNLVSYIFVRFDREISKNVKVIVDGTEGTIAHINIRHLIIRKKGGNELLIPITKVNSMIWEIVRNGD